MESGKTEAIETLNELWAAVGSSVRVTPTDAERERLHRASQERCAKVGAESSADDGK